MPIDLMDGTVTTRRALRIAKLFPPDPAKDARLIANDGALLEDLRGFAKRAGIMLISS